MRLRHAGNELDVWHIAETDEPPADPFGYDAVLSFGGAMHADQEADHSWIAPEKQLLTGLLEAEMPLLGVCLGAQLLAAASGGRSPARRSRRSGGTRWRSPTRALTIRCSAH